MRTIEIGMKLISARFRVRYNSQCQQELKFWEDDDATDPASLVDVTSAFIEVYVDELVTLTWPAVVTGNQVAFNLTPTDTLVDWDTRPFNLVFMKPLRNVVLSGEVVVQR